MYAYHYIHVLFTQFVSQKDQSHHRLIKSNYLSKKGGKIYHFLNTLTCSLEEVIRIKYKKRPFSKVKLIKQHTSSFKKNMSKIAKKKKKSKLAWNVKIGRKGKESRTLLGGILIK